MHTQRVVQLVLRSQQVVGVVYTGLLSNFVSAKTLM